jgi:hypothetical protein
MTVSMTALVRPLQRQVRISLILLAVASLLNQMDRFVLSVQTRAEYRCITTQSTSMNATHDSVPDAMFISNAVAELQTLARRFCNHFRRCSP